MQETINRLREAPKEHRVAVAASIAVAVVAILLIGWFFFFMHNLGKGQLEYTRPAPIVDDESYPSVAMPTQMDTSLESAPPSSAATSAPAASLDGY